ncbi:MAG: hypothetical protein QF719_09525 [Chloroflexota bacterium]|nr:hypothetical protein [Chloroflexota bacterium]MDP6509327.1 hypothetical protein [Chloroflexota bacterium]MDP6758427.1 hypothetical protein [Chloroflexota bacterium]
MSKEAKATNGGHWRQLNWPWWHTGVVNCRMCGQMIPRDVWVAEDGLEFCSPECDGLYRSYWLPRYGDAASPKAGEDAG